jgi:calcineurin-like phosphoesterase family protein
MTTWFTSDLHISHSNICQYSGRPFDSVDEMNAAIVESWNSVVRHWDAVYVLGDLAMGKMDASLPVAGKLQGHKILVPGNHDRCHPKFTGKKSVDFWEGRYHNEAGIEIFLGLNPRINVGHHKGVQTSHFPYSGDHTGEEDRFVELRPVDKGEPLIHGHVHDAWRQKGRQFNVGLDAWGGSLLQEDLVESLLDGDLTLHTDRIPWQT